MIHAILEWGISVIAAIQTVRTPILDQFFIAISNLGSEYFYFAALPILCTMLNRTIGTRIALAILTSVVINSLVKNLVGEARPFTIDPSIRVIDESGFAFPSGHTQQAALFWGLAIHYLRRRWTIVVGALFVGLVGLSRVYLGVHYPTDVLASIVIASIIIFNYRWLVEHGEPLWHPSRKLFVALAVLAMAVIGSVYLPAKDMISAAGLGSGLVMGLLFFDSIPPLSSSIRNRLSSAAVTATVLLVVFVGLKFAFPAKGNAYYEIFSFVRYFLCGVTLSALPILADKIIPRLWQSKAANE